MKEGLSIIEKISFVVLLILMTVFITSLSILVINTATLEYKYTAITPCYDDNHNEIIGIECEYEVKCGILEKSGSEYYPCDVSKFKGKLKK